MKKITYLVASLLLMGTTPMLTGCVDNDEPAGIEELRGAKAELLSAKAAVEAAKVATEQANAAYRNAEAEYVRAQTAYQEALTARINAETESKRLAAEQELAEARAAAERAAKDWELQYRKAEARYQSMLITLAAKQSQAVDDALSKYKEAVADTKTKMETAASALRTKQRELDDALSKLELKKEVEMPSLQRKVVLAEHAVVVQEKVVAEAKKAYEEAPNLQLSDLGVKLAELQDKQHEMDRKLADAHVASAEKKQEYDQIYLPEINKLRKQITDAKNKKVEVPAFDFTYQGALPEGTSGTLNSEKAETSYNIEISNREHPIDNRIEGLKDVLDKLNSWVRDENNNDDAWTTERIVDLKNDLKSIETNYDKVYKSWEAAVLAYRTDPDDGKYDTHPEKIEKEYNALKADVESYNKAADAYNSIQGKINQAKDDKKKADKDLKDAKDKAEVAYNKAINDADETKKKAYEGAPQEAKNQYEANQKAKTAAQKAYDEIFTKFQANPESEELRKQLNAQQVILTETKELASKAEATLQTEIQTKADQTYAAAVLKANTDKTTAENTATETYKKTVAASEKTITDEEKNLVEAEKTLMAAVKKINEDKKGSYDKFIAKFNNEGFTLLTSDYVNAGKNLVKSSADARKTNNKKFADKVKIEAVAMLKHEDLGAAIAYYSNQLFGEAPLADGSDNDKYGDLTIRLVPVTEAQMDAYVKKQISDEQPEELRIGKDGKIEENILEKDRYIAYYEEFGLLGSKKVVAEEIKMLEEYQKNDSDLKEMISTIETAIAETEALKTAMESEVEAAEEAYELKDAEYDEKMKETILLVEEAKMEVVSMQMLLQAYKDAISNYKDSYYNSTEQIQAPEYYTFSEADLERYLIECEEALTKAEDELVKKEKELVEAKQKVANFNEENVKEKYDDAVEEFEEAQAAYKIAEENYNAALEALNKKVAELSVE